MSAYVSIVTLGVSDLARSTAFYESLGWRNTQPSNENVTFLQGHNVILGLYGHDALAEDAEIAPSPSASAPFRGVSLAVNCPSEEAVDSFFADAVSKGAKAQKKPQKVFWGGYSGYFADFDNHLWEVAHNPFFSMDEKGRIQLDPKD